MQDWLLSCSTEINFFQKFFLVPIMLSLKFTANFENLIFLIGVSLLHNVVLVLLYNNMNQLRGYIDPLPLEPPFHHHPLPPLQTVTEHTAELPLLYSRLPLCHTRQCMYVNVTLSICPTRSSPRPCPEVHSLHLCLCSCPADRFHQYHFPRFHKYVLIYIIFLFLSYFTV